MFHSVLAKPKRREKDTLPKRTKKGDTSAPPNEPSETPMNLAQLSDERLARIEVALGIYVDQPAGSQIDQLIQEYLVSVGPDRKHGGWRSTVSRLKNVSRHLGSFIGRDLNHDHADDFLEKRITEGVARSTAAQDIQALGAVFSWAVDRRKMRFNPLSDFKPRAKSGTRDRLYSDSEVDAFLDASRRLGSEEVYALVTIMRWTGLRPLEILTSRRESLDFSTGLLTVTAEVAKTGVERAAAILPDGLAALRQMRPSPWLIPAIRNTANPYPQTTLFLAWKKVVDVSKVLWVRGKKPELYSMRHTLATKLALDFNYGIFELCAAMGWTSVDTAKKYVKPGARHALEMAEKLQRRPAHIVGKVLSLRPIVSDGGVTSVQKK